MTPPATDRDYEAFEDYCWWLSHFGYRETAAAPHSPDECTLSRGGLLICGACEQTKRRLGSPTFKE